MFNAALQIVNELFSNSTKLKKIELVHLDQYEFLAFLVM